MQLQNKSNGEKILPWIYVLTTTGKRKCILQNCEATKTGAFDQLCLKIALQQIVLLVKGEKILSESDRSSKSLEEFSHRCVARLGPKIQRTRATQQQGSELK